MTTPAIPVPDAALPLPDPSDLGTWGARMAEMHRWMREDMRPGMYDLAGVAYDNAAHAETMAYMAGVTAGFAGAWSGLSGALNVPASVYYPHVDADYWVLVVSVTNVEAHTPGVSAAFAPFGATAGSVAFDNTGTDLVADDVQAAIVELSERRGVGRNALINGNFAVNQRGVSGTVVLAAGAYGHDRWKAGAAGCTYTFASSGGVTTLTITAGSLIQVIEGANLRTETYVLDWDGTAQGKIGAGSFSAAGVTSAVTGGSDLAIEFNTGTLALTQFEAGTTPSLFEHRLNELELCQRYYERIVFSSTGLAALSGLLLTGSSNYFQWNYKQTKRAAPTVALASGAWVGATPSISANAEGAVFSHASSYFYANGSSGAIALTATSEL